MVFTFVFVVIYLHFQQRNFTNMYKRDASPSSLEQDARRVVFVHAPSQCDVWCENASANPPSAAKPDEEETRTFFRVQRVVVQFACASKKSRKR
jgi:hypothetical protein